MRKTALALAIAFALFGCTSRQPGAGDTAVQPKGPAPEFDLENVAGGKTKAADLKGKVSVIDFWATWCEPCWSEVPKYNKMLDEYQGKDVQIVGITVESPRADLQPKAKELG